MDANERLLLAAGQVLNKKYVQRIQDLQIPFVYIKDPLGVVNCPPLVGPQIITDTINSLKDYYEEFAQTEKADLKPLKSQVDYIIDDISRNNNIMIGISDLKDYDDYTYQHSVNVCALSIALGIRHGYSRPQLQQLGMGALLHDIGKISLPLEIINKPDHLTFEEYTVVKRHPWEGSVIARDTNKGLSQESVKGILQHHERLDGSGYPRGLSNGNIHPNGMIIAVADTFDALVSNRPYRAAFNNKQAIEIMEKERGTHLSPVFMDYLLSIVNIYPPGSVVNLSNGDQAVVTEVNPNDYSKPLVKLLFDDHGQAYDVNDVFSLEENLNVSILMVVEREKAEKRILNYLKMRSREPE
ncbi:MAG TPA: HD-GYP domain-containing protein [Syntrophomonas sp.]|nr:HD-GYP domain-containing protein [Syntrophomonas sp.]